MSEPEEVWVVEYYEGFGEWIAVNVHNNRDDALADIDTQTEPEKLRARRFVLAEKERVENG